MLGDPLLIGPLQEGVDGGGGGAVGDLDELFNPDEVVEADLHAGHAALTVGAILGDGFAAGAEGHDGDLDAEREAGGVAVGVAEEVAAELEHGGGAGGGRLALDEVGEVDADVGAGCVEGLAQVLDEERQGGEGDLAAVPFERFDEAAHVGALVLVGQVDGEGEVADGLLRLLVAVPDDHGVLELGDAGGAEGDAALVGGGLDVNHGLGHATRLVRRGPR